MSGATTDCAWTPRLTLVECLDTAETWALVSLVTVPLLRHHQPRSGFGGGGGTSRGSGHSLGCGSGIDCLGGGDSGGDGGVCEIDVDSFGKCARSNLGVARALKA